MNHIYRVVFNRGTGLTQVASECTRSHSKSHSETVSSLLISLLLWPVAQAASLPSGATVTSGSASISTNGPTMTIQQSTNKVAINWQNFSIDSGHSVTFNQPSASAIALNRVVGNESSVIAGALSANGKVFLINSNGILFSKLSSVNVGGLVASTQNLSDADFNADRYLFTGNSTNSVINLGKISATDGGYIALLGNSVRNEGVIAANKGTVAMAAGDKITLNFNGDSLLNITLDQGTLNALVDNQGAVYADGGTIILSAKAADDLLSAQVNHSGIIQARTLDDLTGSVSLYAHGGNTTVSGTIDASAPNGGNGGFIETSGNKVSVTAAANITTQAISGQYGTWLIDPDGYTISTGGDISGADLSSKLANTNIIIASTNGTGSDGNITVNDAISWAADTTLTLNATNDININNAITVSGNNAGVSLNYSGNYNIRTPASYAGTTTNSSGNLVAQTDTSGGTYGKINFTACQNATSCANTSFTINGLRYTLIGSMDQLDLLDGYNAATASGTTSAVTGHYALAHDLNAAGTTYSTALISSFSGTLAGLGHTIDGLTINTLDDNVGLIGQTASGSTTALRDIGITNFSLTTSSGRNYGALLGSSNSAALTVNNAYSTGNINADNGIDVGGLIGATSDSGSSVISNASSSVNITAYLYGGGLLGYAGGSTGANGYYTLIQNSHASGNVTGKSRTYASGQKLGGLVGAFSGHGSITNSYATGQVISHSSLMDAYSEIPGMDIGGLVGSFDAADANYTNSVTNSFATGDVTGSYSVGGLIGYIKAAAASYLNVRNTYATGNVTATSTTGTEANVGGLIGYGNYLNITASHATGNVTQALTEGKYKGLTTNMASNVGGLIGGGVNTTIDNSYAAGTVSASNVAANVGGLAGSATTITNSYATGNVSGLSYVGGLAGNATTITSSYASGNVAGTGNGVGGLAGGASTITSSHATGDVSGFFYVGGLLGTGTVATIRDSYATGDVSGTRYIGGLAGAARNIYSSWTSGSVTGAAGYTGALVGQLTNKGVIDSSYWDSDHNSQSGAYGTISGISATKTVTVTNSTGLSGAAADDIAYYANNTIDAILAQRAETARIQQELAATLARRKRELQDHADDSTGKSDANTEEARRRAAQTAAAVAQEKNTQVAIATHPADVSAMVQIVDPAQYSANVDSIEIDGKTFKLNE